MGHNWAEIGQAYVRLIRATHTAAELDRARLAESFMLPAPPGPRRIDVRENYRNGSHACKACDHMPRPCSMHHCRGREIGVVASAPIVRPEGYRPAE